MIYTVTFNPAIDYVVRLDTPLEVGEVNRAKGEDCVLGGKGINVSGVLAEMSASTSTGKPLRPLRPKLLRTAYMGAPFCPMGVLRLHLLTGRTHQIRVHLSHAGHPLLGDDLYGGDIRLIDRQALHAFSVRFTHPETGETLYFEAPLPEDMQKLITKKKEK